MKKIICLVMVLTLAFSLCLTVNAATGINANEKAVLDALKSKEALGKNGWSFSIPTEYITAAENYFNTIDMTDAEKENILSFIEEGKKIGAKDGLRALYCILHYGAHVAPIPMQFILYLFIGGLSALANLAIFMALANSGFLIILVIT